MARDAAHKELVDAILDGEIDAEAIAARAAELGPEMAENLTRVTREIFARRLAHAITAEQAEQTYRYAYICFALIGFAHVAQDAKDHAEITTAAIAGAAKKLGSGVSTLEKIRKLDRVAREVERGRK